jgi:hypothetical protein
VRYVSASAASTIRTPTERALAYNTVYFPVIEISALQYAVFCMGIAAEGGYTVVQPLHSTAVNRKILQH